MTVEKYALYSRMKRALAESTSRNTAGVRKASVREYRYAYGAIEPLTGKSCFLVMPYCNTACMNLFLRELSKQFPQDIILMCYDRASWQRSGALDLTDNIVLSHIPPYTPEMNPIK